MPDERFDVVVVGAGLAGLVAAVEASRSGARTVVLDAQPPSPRFKVASHKRVEPHPGWSFLA